MSQHDLRRFREPGSAVSGSVASSAAAEQTGWEGQPARAAPKLDSAQRRAQVAALCGVMLARNRRYAAAEERFVDATTHDPEFDLTALEGFWTLPRGAQDAAVRAYERVGRIRDAAALAAWLRWTFRPRALPSADSPDQAR